MQKKNEDGSAILYLFLFGIIVYFLIKFLREEEVPHSVTRRNELKGKVVTIYTDGSQQEDLCSIGVYSTLLKEVNYSAVLADRGKNCQDGEVRAVLRALANVPSHVRELSTVIIVTDLNYFKSGLLYMEMDVKGQRKAERTWERDTMEFIRKFQRELEKILKIASCFSKGVYFLCVPGHSKIIGNEIADALSKIPRYSGNLQQLVWNKQNEMKGSKKLVNYKINYYYVRHDPYSHDSWTPEECSWLEAKEEFLPEYEWLRESLFPQNHVRYDDQWKLQNLVELMASRRKDPVNLKQYLAACP